MDEQKKHSCEQELNELKDKFLRISADFENYKKRVEKEESHWIDNAQATVLKDLLNIVDDFDRALEVHKKEENPEYESFIKGFELIDKSLHKLLESYKVKEMTSYENFDPRFHEAILQVESKEHKPGQIIEVMQKGYSFKDIVLRPAKVSVAK